MKVRKVQDGFSAVVVLPVISLVLVAALGWYIWSQGAKGIDTAVKDTTTQSTPTASTAANSASGAPAPASAAQTDTSKWVKKTIDSKAVSYYVPPTWGDQVAVERFVPGDQIHIGYGNPVYVRYDQQKQQWQTLELDASGTARVQADNMVSTSSVQVDGTFPASYYITGDGPTAETRVLVVHGQEIFQFTLPAACDMCQEEPRHTEQEVKDALPAFIERITFKQG